VTSNTTVLEQRRDTRLLRTLGMSRYAVGIAVIGTFVAATVLLVYGAIEVFQLVGATFGAGNLHGVERGASPPLLSAISAVEAFLVAIVLYVIAVGFYQLFFHPLPLPAWLVVEDLAELELKLVEVVISTLGVVFLGQVVTWDGRRDLQGFGIGTALVIGALAYAISRVAPRDTVAQPTHLGRNESATDAQPIANDSALREA
jgi:uncharacterized membrane protein YqhA